MPTENVNKADNLIDVGEADQQSTEINLDNKGEPEKVEAPKEEKIEVEQVEEPTKEVDKSFENERETKLCLLYTSPSPRDRQKSRMPSSA